MISPLRGYPGLSIEDARVQDDATGAIAVWSVKQDPGVFVTRASGKMTALRAKIIDESSSEHIRSVPRYTSFHDWEQLRDYEVEARLRLVAVAVKLRGRGEVNLLVTSRIILAAVDTAQVILKTLRIHSDRESFENALAACLRPTAHAPAQSSRTRA